MKNRELLTTHNEPFYRFPIRLTNFYWFLSNIVNYQFYRFATRDSSSPIHLLSVESSGHVEDHPTPQTNLSVTGCQDKVVILRHCKIFHQRYVPQYFHFLAIEQSRIVLHDFAVSSTVSWTVCLAAISAFAASSAVRFFTYSSSSGLICSNFPFCSWTHLWI